MRGDWSPLDLTASTPDFVRASGPAVERLDPAVGELVAVTPTSTGADVDRAVAAARAAGASSWTTDAALRSRILSGFATSLRGDVEPLAELLTREQGKTIHEARGEVYASASILDFFAGAAQVVFGRTAPLSDRATGVVLREPVGTVAVISPWNWPVVLTVRALAPALAAGNPCVVKPASLTSATVVEALARLAAAEGLPPGVVSCVLGAGSTVGRRLVSHPGIGAVAFTGETATGVEVMQAAAANLTKVVLELGGKSPNVVFADADLDRAVAGACRGIFTTCGQICTAGSRLIVEREAYADFAERMVAAIKGLRIGDPLDEATQLGPLASEGQKRKVLEFVELGKAEGTLLAGGEPVDAGNLVRGHFVSPALFSGIEEGSPLFQAEVFGPVLTLHPFDSDEEAIALANGTEYGLAAGVWTGSLDRAWRLGRKLEAGTVWVNTYNEFCNQLEAGSRGRSGLGQTQGLGGMEEFTRTRQIHFGPSR